MNFQELIVLLPCHSLEDFPTYHTGEDAEGLLASWCGPWHPALIASAEQMPCWSRADDPPTELDGRLLVISSAANHEIPAGFAARAKTEGAHVVRNLVRRDELVAAALEALGNEAKQVDPALAEDFLALGYCYLQTELLTRRMRYMSCLDEVHFRNLVVAGAKAAVEGDEAKARDQLTQCFSVLVEARGHFYPVDNYLLDFTLTAPTTLGPALENELAAAEAHGTPINLLLSGETLEQLAAQSPELLARLQAAWEQGAVGLLGGPRHEDIAPLLPLDAILANLRDGLRLYEQYLGRRPEIFGRRRAGLTPALPQLLHQLGFRGAWHVTLDDGRFPQSDHSKTCWEGIDSTSIQALARVPLDANQATSFLNLYERLSDSMDHDFVATAYFAHWPGQVSCYYRDLRRMAGYAPVLGKFITIERFFRDTEAPTLYSKFSPHQYRTPYLSQAIIRREADPISSVRRRLQAEAAAEAVAAMQTLAALLGHPPDNPPTAALQDQPAAASQPPETTAALAALSAALSAGCGSASRGRLVINPLSFSRRIGVELGELPHLPAVDDVVRAAEEGAGCHRAVVEVPGLGFAWVEAAQAPTVARRAVQPLAAEHTLRNEFCEVTIHPRSGGIQAVRDFRSRGNRLSQQLAFRLPAARGKPGDVWRDPDEDALYSTMVADAIETTVATSVLGEITSRGRLLDPQEQPLAEFVQRVRLWRGRPVIELDIELAPNQEPRADPWNSYYACRFAWADATADLRRSVHLGSHATDGSRLEAPHFVEVVGEQIRTAILTGGLPYHRRVGLRMLDSLLIVRGETARRFRLGVGLDLPHPWQAAVELLAPQLGLASVPPPASGRSGWMFHIDARHVAATGWSPLEEQGRVVGFCARLLEVEGRPGRVRLRCFRAPLAARRVNYQGEPLGDLAIEEDAVQLTIAPHEWVHLEARWEKSEGNPEA
jgi:alpha-mannosidase